MNLVHVKTSILLERALEKQSSAGVQARPYVERGLLVPDAIITAMVLQRIKESEVIERGCILEGFPKTKEQALALLRSGFIPDHVVDIDIPDSRIIATHSVIRFDPVTQKTYNIDTDMSAKNPIIEARLIQKVSNESMLQRLKTHRNNYRDVIGCFPNQSARFWSENGLEAMEHRLVNDIQVFLGSRPKSNSPRGFKIIVSGLPGSGKSTISDYIGEKFGAVVGIIFLIT
jgi:adenylate kinase family enzyme